MKAYIWSLLVLLLMGSINVWAQGDDDAVIFKAMEDEMNRGMKELKQADSKPICCIGVNAVYGRTFMVRGILGGNYSIGYNSSVLRFRECISRGL